MSDCKHANILYLTSEDTGTHPGWFCSECRKEFVPKERGDKLAEDVRLMKIEMDEHRLKYAQNGGLEYDEGRRDEAGYWRDKTRAILKEWKDV